MNLGKIRALQSLCFQLRGVKSKMFGNKESTLGGDMRAHRQANTDHLYEEAVRTLNSLQTNAAVLERARQERSRNAHLNVPATAKFLSRAGLSLAQVDNMSIIHVAGTKGKGSTCAFVESILREHGYKTGFYSSPHLVAARERIRINGQPINKEEFTQHFWDVYNALLSKKGIEASEEEMPAYFKFLTVMALRVFMHEAVDVVVLEVGIGGEYDCTNVVRKPIVCGITSLDLDHTSLLGTTIESIAWHKSGIMKSEVPVFTVEQQQGHAFGILKERADEKGCNLYVVPPLECYGWGIRPLHLGLAGSVQYGNASLALQLSQYWINKKEAASPYLISYEEASTLNGVNYKMAKPFSLSDEDICGLRSVKWPGRSQVMSCGPLTYFIDGAHTPGSINACVDWFSKVSVLHAPPEGESVYRVLLFNSTGDRDPATLLEILSSVKFDLAVFTTNLATMSMSPSSDQTNYMVSQDNQYLRCERQRRTWIELVRNMNQKCTMATQNYMEEPNDQPQINTYDQSPSGLDILSEVPDPFHWQEQGLDISSSFPADDVPTITFSCIMDALVWLSCGRDSSLKGELQNPPAFLPSEKLKSATQVQVLVTGSLHLVGGVLGVLDPTLTCATHNCIRRSPAPSLMELVRTSYNCAHYSSPGAP